MRNPHELIEPSAFAKSFLATIETSKRAPVSAIVDSLMEDFGKISVPNLNRHRTGCQLAMAELEQRKPAWYETGRQVLRDLQLQTGLGSEAANRIIQTRGGPSAHR